MQNNNLRSQLLKNYISLFLLITIIGIFSTFLIINIGGFIQKNSIENTFKAKNFLRENYRDIDAEALIDYGGGIEVINKEKQVLLAKGNNVTRKKKLSEEEFSEYLFNMKTPDDQYNYDVVYNSKENFWIIINYPVDFEVRMYINRNNQVNDAQSTRISLFIMTTFVIYFFLFFIGLLLYSRMTAKSFIKPLNQLINAFKKVINEEKYEPVKMEANEEFVQLNNIFNQMIKKIEQEKLLRRESEENRKKLVLDISHDLKNPLASILGYSELMCSENISQETLVKYSNIINRNAKRSNELITDLFDYSKLNSEDYFINKENVDFTEYIRRYVVEHIDLLDSESFDYDFIIPEHRINVAIDQKLFKRALNNILNNAIKYNDSGTKIRIEILEENDYVRITISDDGDGIPSELRNNIFKPFASNMKSESSSGLGLAICKKIVDKHNGELIYHKNQKKGTAFTIILEKT
ncbi:MAG TPA: HAMP domain-containing sensor histidine kinase [Clostridia bacterium]|nr:HAMP domain-containing sensor histidine kinase [Clostridia bacterium]